jgi:exopolysaccharide production protein ExoQ
MGDATAHASRPDPAKLSAGSIVDMAVVVLGTLPLLLVNLVGKLGLLAFFAALTWQAVRSRDVLLARLAPAWPVAIFPALAVCSTMWSDAPALTFRNAVQFALSLLFAVLIARTVSTRNLQRAIVVAFLAALALGFVAGQRAELVDGTSAFLGIKDSKNANAYLAGIVLLMSLGLLVEGSRPPGWVRGLGIAGMILGTAGLVLARSAGALVAFSIALAVVVGLLVISRANTRMRVFLLVAAMCAAPVATLAKPAMDRWVENFMTGGLGKDASLTGRTEIWQHADILIRNRPVLGHGFKAFWRQGSLEAEGLWRTHHVRARGGFNFHNQFREVLVDLGIAGLIAFIIPIVVGYPLLLRQTAAGERAAIGFVGVTTASLVLTPLESSISNQFSPEVFVFYMGCTIGLAALHRRSPANRPSRSLRQVPALGPVPDAAKIR